MTATELIGRGGALGAGRRHGLGLLLARGAAVRPRDLSANLIGPCVVGFAVHVGPAQTLPSSGRAIIATGALGGHMLVSTLQAAHAALKVGCGPLVPWRPSQPPRSGASWRAC